ncbi:hypothetical protein [Ralstonia pickettii]|uniref:hypothetical protein n=1 Tax=Ralstonia pickettii TaxID=329 RepID=UPI0015BD8BB7|nr:hypothetical protein [Ralstonia pickettii]NWK43317.1 hypothetical protein [Ralstonia pickettii]
MFDIPTAKARLAAVAQLRATLIEYFKRAHWTPLEGCLIVSGIHPSPGCTEIPSGGIGLDNKLLHANSSRLRDARNMWDAWNDYRESQQEDGEDIPDHLKPMEFMEWVDGCQVGTDWLPAFHDLMERRDGSDKPDVIPSAIATFANEALTSVDAIVGRLEAVLSNSKPASQTLDHAHSPTPIPANRDHILAAGDAWGKPCVAENDDRPQASMLTEVDELDSASDLEPDWIPTSMIVDAFGQWQAMPQHQRLRWRVTFSNPTRELKRTAQRSYGQGREAVWSPIEVALWLQRVRKWPIRALDEVFGLRFPDWAPLWAAESARLRRETQV